MSRDSCVSGITVMLVSCDILWLLPSAPRFEAGTGPIHLFSVECRGSEVKLLDCPHSVAEGESICTHSKDIGIECGESEVK